MSCSEGVFEIGLEFSEANNILLMSLLEETQEEEYYGDDRLVRMIQSLEAEISDTEMGHMDDQDCSTSDSGSDDHWVDMEVISSLPFDEMNNAWIPCGDEMMMEHAPMPYETGNDIDDFLWYCGVFLEQQYGDNYLAQGPSDAVF